MKQYLCLLALLCLFIKVSAQEKPDLSGLSIGDRVPEVFLENLLNHPAGQARLSDYKGKWLILDFWATWCSPCIAMFPKTDSLQEAFKEQVGFLAVTYEKREKVKKLFNNLKALEGLHPPIVLEDSILRALFPHRSLPHYVWINPAGRVAAITGKKEITAENIKAMLRRSKADLTAKKDTMIPFDRQEPLLTGNEALPQKPVLYQSVLMAYVEGLPSMYFATDRDSLRGRRIVATNARIPTLYQMAYGFASDTYLYRNRTILEVADTTRMDSPLSGQAYRKWQKQGNVFCYELIVPPTSIGQEWELMQEDLKRYFPQYMVSVETWERPVLALVSTSGEDSRFATRGGSPFFDIKPYAARMRNRSLKGLILQLNAKYLQHLPTPVVDRTGYRGNVDLTLDATMSNVTSIRRALRQYGLDLVEQKAEIPMLVIRDAGKTGISNK